MAVGNEMAAGGNGVRVKTALLSVYDKTGLVEFARGLAGLGIKLISTGGTYRILQEAGLAVTYISEVTGFPEIMDGRVKTLHPAIHGGILARRDNPAHMEELARQGIRPIDMVVVNLYPFVRTVNRPGVPMQEAVENIDIGGPVMIRAAAKNFEHVAVVVDPRRYEAVLWELQGNGGALFAGTRLGLAREAFAHTAGYDALIHDYFHEVISRPHGDATADAPANAPVDASSAEPASESPVSFPDHIFLNLARVQELRYGENPHQAAAFYRQDPGLPEREAEGPASLVTARKLHGKELSFNNINDADAALQIVREFSGPAAVAVKHTNPCGVAVGKTIAEAFSRAHAADPVSIFGGIVALNRPVDLETARLMSGIFLEVVLAPEFAPEALAVLQKKSNLRLLATGGLPGAPNGAGALQRPVVPFFDDRFDLKRVTGGFLVQERDVAESVAESVVESVASGMAGGMAGGAVRDEAPWRVVTRRGPDAKEVEDLRFAWRVVKHVKSNAIVIAKAGQTLGVGAGQMNRIDAALYAINRAGTNCRGAVMASDAFFPMPDVVEAAAKGGVTAIIQPGGSIRDEDSVAAADAAGIAMIFTGVRHFKH